jgi:hypothetical protein
MSPQILIGVSNSIKIGCEMNISFAVLHNHFISFSVKAINLFGFRLFFFIYFLFYVLA